MLLQVTDMKYLLKILWLLWFSPIYHLISSLHFFYLKENFNSWFFCAGYKVITRNSSHETTVLGADQTGLMILCPERLTSQKLAKEINSAIIVISVKDALVLATSGIKSHIICLPHGNDCYLSHFEILNLWSFLFKEEKDRG